MESPKGKETASELADEANETGSGNAIPSSEGGAASSGASVEASEPEMTKSAKKRQRKAEAKAALRGMKTLIGDVKQGMAEKKQREAAREGDATSTEPEPETAPEPVPERDAVPEAHRSRRSLDEKTPASSRGASRDAAAARRETRNEKRLGDAVSVPEPVRDGDGVRRRLRAPRRGARRVRRAARRGRRAPLRGRRRGERRGVRAADGAARARGRRDAGARRAPRRRRCARRGDVRRAGDPGDGGRAREALRDLGGGARGREPREPSRARRVPHARRLVRAREARGNRRAAGGAAAHRRRAPGAGVRLDPARAGPGPVHKQGRGPRRGRGETRRSRRLGAVRHGRRRGAPGGPAGHQGLAARRAAARGGGPRAERRGRVGGEGVPDGVRRRPRRRRRHGRARPARGGRRVRVGPRVGARDGRDLRGGGARRGGGRRCGGVRGPRCRRRRRARAFRGKPGEESLRAGRAGEGKRLP